jgi:hypothetical protein
VPAFSPRASGLSPRTDVSFGLTMQCLFYFTGNCACVYFVAGSLTVSRHVCGS